MFAALVAAACLISGGASQSTGVPSITISTAVPSPSAAIADALPSQSALPPKQAWCPSEIFCAGQLLQTVNVADLYPDDKTFVDKPTAQGSQLVLDAFNNLSNPVTYGQVVDFVDTNFKGEGLELEAQALSSFDTTPSFLNNVSNPIVKAFSQTVHGYWTQLVRSTNDSILCPQGPTGCESSLIPLNHTFVVPGGRFREQYYWDSYWIVEGLIQSEVLEIVNGTLQNFMDELEHIGFIPNGGRIYYLNRSQPPLFTQMLARYVEVSGDRAILQRALPLAEKEIAWFNTNRSLQVTSPFTNKTHLVYHYAVNNSAPRPESYLTDYTTANDPSIKNPLNDTQKAALYAELASGAESGWDYTVRWFAQSQDGSNDGLRSLNVRNTLPVDLNSILYKNHQLLASLYGTENTTARNRHRSAADALQTAILDLFWDAEKLAFYDFNLGTKTRNGIFSAATFYPLWSGIIPSELLGSQEKAFGFFSSINLVLNRYNGTFPTTFIDSGLQWDAPNAWPPHQYIALQALRALPSNITSNTLPTPSGDQSTFNLIPNGQLGLNEDQLPGQPISSVGSGVTNATTSGPSADVNKLNGTVYNGGNATNGEGWATALERQLANRYITSTFCSWHATGGSLEGLVPRLSNQELNITNSINNTGNMFEKFSNLDVDSAGRGGEYTVQAGFGWTNGVVLWVASTYGNVLNAPTCPSLLNDLTVGNAAMASASFTPKTLVLVAIALLAYLMA